MKEFKEAILRTNDYNEDYKIVKVLQERVSETNRLSVVEIDGKQMMTGGILIENHLVTRIALDSLTPEEQWSWLNSIKNPKIY